MTTNDFRIILQSKLKTINGLDCGEIIGDELIEEGQYYFGYKLNRANKSNNLDYSNTSQIITLTGYLSTKGGSLKNIDQVTDDIIKVLGELRMLCSSTDITTLGTSQRRVLITGTVKYDNIDRLLK